MEIKHTNDEKKGFFKVFDSENEAGLMTYTWINNQCFSIDHTAVYLNYEGKGIGKELVMAAVEFAREKNCKIVPLCEFAKVMFKRIPEIRDVL